jgi:hypothetical protein
MYFCYIGFYSFLGTGFPKLETLSKLMCGKLPCLWAFLIIHGLAEYVNLSHIFLKLCEGSPPTLVKPAEMISGLEVDQDSG